MVDNSDFCSDSDVDFSDIVDQRTSSSAISPTVSHAKYSSMDLIPLPKAALSHPNLQHLSLNLCTSDLSPVLYHPTLDLRTSPTSHTCGLFNYFSVTTRDEHLMNNHWSDEHWREDVDARKSDRALDEIEKKT